MNAEHAKITRDVLKRIDQAHGAMSIHRVLTLLELGLQGGDEVSYASLLSKLGWDAPQLSKNLTEMSLHGRRGAGLNWVRVDLDPTNRQRRIVSFTGQGRKFIDLVTGE